MGLETLIVGSLLLGVGGGAAVESREQRRAAERDQKRARAAEKRIQDIRAARERRAAVREARMARAQAEQGAVASGAAGSGQASGIGTIGTQLAVNLSFLDQVKALSDQSSIFQEKAARHYSRAQDASDFSSLAMQGASLFASAGAGAPSGGGKVTGNNYGRGGGSYHGR